MLSVLMDVVVVVELKWSQGEKGFGFICNSTPLRRDRYPDSYSPTVAMIPELFS
jgi:hypothetical protein